MSLLFTACGMDWTKRSETPAKADIINSDNYTNNSNRELPSEAGKCYAQCADNNDNAVGVKRTISVIISPATTRWEKRKADPNCQSENPEDCMVMCLVDVPAVIEAYYVSTDTLINHQKNTEISFKRFKKVYGETCWNEVLCEKDITYDKILALQQALNNKGYNVGAADGLLNYITKAQLKKFQTENGLPEGNLNIETLKILGVL